MNQDPPKSRGGRRRYGNKPAFEFTPRRTIDDLSAGEVYDIYQEDHPALVVAMAYDVPIEAVQAIWRCQHSRPEIASCEPRVAEPRW